MTEFEAELEKVDDEYHGLYSLTEQEVEDIAKRFYKFGIKIALNKIEPLTQCSPSYLDMHYDEVLGNIVEKIEELKSESL